MEILLQDREAKAMPADSRAWNLSQQCIQFKKDCTLALDSLDPIEAWLCHIYPLLTTTALFVGVQRKREMPPASTIVLKVFTLPLCSESRQAALGGGASHGALMWSVRCVLEIIDLSLRLIFTALEY
jgi:hypothetical protein